MNIDIHHVPLTHELASEMDAMFDAYYMTTMAHTDIPLYDYDWPLYYALHDAGKIVMTTARLASSGFLVGVSMYIVMHTPHHRTVVTAECDGISVDPAFRGHGIAERMIAYTLPLLKDRGVKQVFNRYRVCYNTKPLFEKLGFCVTEHVYMKEL